MVVDSAVVELGVVDSPAVVEVVVEASAEGSAGEAMEEC